MSYQQLLDICREQNEEIRRAANEPPVACPEDGEPLQTIKSIRHCRFCGWQWPHDQIR